MAAGGIISFGINMDWATWTLGLWQSALIVFVKQYISCRHTPVCSE